jgi:site-specific recombinase XerD
MLQQRSPHAARPALPSEDAWTPERIVVGEHVVLYRTAKSPRWYMQYQFNGKQYRPSLRTRNKKKALQLSQKKDAELLLGVAAAPARRSPKIGEAREKYIATQKDRGRTAETRYLYNRDLQQFEAYCQDKGVTRLSDVSTDLLEDYQRLLASTGYRVPGRKDKRGFRDGAVKPRTVRGKMKTVRQLIRFAMRRQMIASDPSPGYYLPAKIKGQASCWTAPELKSIFDHLDAEHVDVFHFLRMTGLRSDELCWLTKDDFDAHNSQIKIRAKTCPQTGAPWRPKHGNERDVPLSPEAHASATAAANSSPSPWLFHAPDTAKKQFGHWQGQRLWKLLKQAMKAARVAHGTVHTFRHVYCSFLANNRASSLTPFQVMKIMGHGSMDIVLQYFHVNDKEMQQAVRSLSFAPMLEGGKEGKAK